jgi:hypothetical protein
MTDIQEIKRLISLCNPAEREQLFRQLRQEIIIHPLEQELHAKAEIILEAIRRAGGVTLRMLRGVIAEAAFGVEIVEKLKGWRNVAFSGESACDFLLKDRRGVVRVQVKLQRSKKNNPLLATDALRLFRGLPPDMYVVETQKTRAGRKKVTGASTRPYRFGEFDLLAVALYPSTHRWDQFVYTVTDWLMPSPIDPTLIFKYQPVSSTPNQDWTDNFEKAVNWLRSGRKKTIRHAAEGNPGVP